MDNIEKTILSMLKRNEIVNGCVGVRKPDNSVEYCLKVKLNGHWYILSSYITTKLKKYIHLSGDICEDCFKKQLISS
ncbi:MAG: hypothetical protein AB1571_02095 [Nanoarchaeota archaeon]